MMLQRRTRIYNGSDDDVPKSGVGIPIVVVVVSYPATTLTTARVRFCVSASHTKEDIDAVLEAVDEVGGILGLKMGKVPQRERWTLDECKRRAVELVEQGC
jgi:serine palmitoyltransferase